jgi:hypothetical protein
MKTIEPETTLSIDAASVMTKGDRFGLVADVTEGNF